MGTVWSARRTDTGEAVAVKILSENPAQDPDLVGRFLRERAALMSVRHPNLVEIRDLVVENQRVALVMELVEGYDAARLLESNGPLELRAAARLGAEIAQALTAVHLAGIVHRDLKPANILVESATGRAKLVDFGIAWIAGNPRLTAANSVVGTPHYLAPELLTGGQISGAADVYALAICLYQLLSGVVPFDGEHYAQILHKHLNEAPRPHPAIPATMWSLIEAMLAKNPAARPDLGLITHQLAVFGGSAPYESGGYTVPAAMPAPAGPGMPASAVPATPMPAGYTDPDAALLTSAGPVGAYPGYPAPGQNPWSDPSSFTPNPPPFELRPEPERRSRGKLWLIVCLVLVVCGVGAGAWALTSGGGGRKPVAEASSSSAPAVTPLPKLSTHHWTLCCGQLQDRKGDTTATDNGVVLNPVNKGDASFDGKPGTQIVVDGPVIDTRQSFTIAFWMAMHGTTTTASGRETMVEQRGTEGCAACVEFDPTTGRVVFAMQDADAASAHSTQVVALAPPTTGAWYHIIASYDSAHHKLSLYIGGTLQGTAKLSTDWAPTGPLSFGSGLEGGVVTNWYAGSLGDMWLWNRAMTPGQVDHATK
jgi:serine/threonine protein kinase